MVFDVVAVIEVASGFESFAYQSSTPELEFVEREFPLGRRKLRRVASVALADQNGPDFRFEERNAIIRGLRALSDFEFEFNMALMNRHLKPQIETIFVMPNEQFSYTSSSLVKQVAKYRKNEPPHRSRLRPPRGLPNVSRWWDSVRWASGTIDPTYLISVRPLTSQRRRETRVHSAMSNALWNGTNGRP